MKSLLKIMLCLACLLAMAGSAPAGGEAVFHLRDGSVIRGVVTSHSHRTYIVKTQSMGELRIHETKIASMESGAGAASEAAYAAQPAQAASGAQGGNDMGAQTQALQQQMMADPEIMALITALGNDPEMQAVLADPAIMNAVSAGDLNALMANPRFVRLLNNSQVKEITRKAVQ